MPNPSHTSPLRSHAPAAVSLQELTEDWGREYDVLASYCGDSWAARFRDGKSPWIGADTAAVLAARIRADYNSRSLRRGARPQELTPAAVKAECEAIRDGNPGWKAWRGRNKLWHAQCGRLQAHGDTPDELRGQILEAKRGRL